MAVDLQTLSMRTAHTVVYTEWDRESVIGNNDQSRDDLIKQ